jgi:hypothetical protein
MTPLQAAIDAINAIRYTDDKGLLIAAKCRALMAGYAKRWADSQYVPIEVEVTLQTDLLNPDSGRHSRLLQTAGMLDVVAMYGQQKILIDHKSTSDDITDPAGSYWRQLVVESQPSHYLLLKWINGEKLDCAMWDVIHKPSISPRQFKSKAEKALTVANRSYCGRPLSQETLDYLQVNDRENLEMYEARLADDCCNVRPEHYFARRTIPRLDAELRDYAKDLWECGQIIIEARRKNRYPKHPASCMNYGRPCQYLGICSNFDNPESANWTRRDNVHEELPTVEGESRSVLTFSSIRTYQSCPRKFYFRYEKGLKRVDEEEAEALFFGHVIHKGLEAYWRSLLPEEVSHGGSYVAPSSGASDDSQNVDF